MDIDIVWIWGIGGLALLAAELVAPGFYLLWVGCAALIVCGVAASFEVPLKAQLLVFAVSALATCIAGWFVYRGQRLTAAGLRPDDINESTVQMLGSIGEVLEPGGAGQMRIKVRDSVWLATGPDLAAGMRVRVIGQNGTVLKVEALTI
jgi:inner membrane protein